MHNEPEIQEIDSNYANGHEPLTFGFKAFQNTGPEKNVINPKEHAKPSENPVPGGDHHETGIDDGQIDQSTRVLAGMLHMRPQYKGKKRRDCS